jgi:predicted phosphoribosyltransferase
MKVFLDREEAGRLLAERLTSIVSRPCVVAAIPRGGLVVGLPIAERLEAPLTLAPTRKLTVPSSPEFAFGAVDADGEAIVDEVSVAELRLDPEEIEEAKVRVKDEIDHRSQRYGAPPLIDYMPESDVVLVDDGLATGLTMQSALAYARRHGAHRVTVAAPCASDTAAQRFQRDADAFVSLIIDPDFLAVGAYYLDFREISDEEVAEILALSARRTERSGSAREETEPKTD